MVVGAGGTVHEDDVVDAGAARREAGDGPPPQAARAANARDIASQRLARRGPPAEGITSRVCRRITYLVSAGTPLPPLAGNPLLEERLRLGALDRRGLTRQRLVRRYSYGVPTDDVLAAIARVSPKGVVELGAGTGYWARQLHDRGVDVVAYDRSPPSTAENDYVDRVTWFPVLVGDERSPAQHPERTLLIVWPSPEESWAADACAAFHAAGGEVVVYVGEGPGGRTGDDALHRLLGDAGPCLGCDLGVIDVACVCEVVTLWTSIDVIARCHVGATPTTPARSTAASTHGPQRAALAGGTAWRLGRSGDRDQWARSSPLSRSVTRRARHGSRRLRAASVQRARRWR